MNFRLKMVAWWVLSVVLIVGLLFAAAHWHLDGELRKDGRDRSHPRHPEWTIHGSYIPDIPGGAQTIPEKYWRHQLSDTQRSALPRAKRRDRNH